MAEISEIPSSRARFAAHDTLHWKYPFAYETLKANTLQRDKELGKLNGEGKLDGVSCSVLILVMENPECLDSPRW